MSKLVKRFLTEPLIQFFILGALLFFIYNYIQKQTELQSREIIVDNERIGQILVTYKTQTGALPNKQQLDFIIENYINEEISYREAVKMGLDKDDEIIRRRLVQKFDFIRTDLAAIDPPTEDELRRFYENNYEQFQKDTTVNYTHVFFSTDNCSDSMARQKALSVLQELKNGILQRAPEKGDRFPLQYDYTGQARRDIQQNFGNKPILDELFRAPVNTWTGPVQSGYGWHLVYVSERDTMTQLPYTGNNEDISSKFIETEKAKHSKEQFEKLSEKYVINRQYLETK